jgi:hypothetical protein
MNSRKAEALLKKYWEGETDQHEEMELKEFFSSEKGHAHTDAEYFRHLDGKSNEDPLDAKFDEELLGLIGHAPTAEKSITGFSMKYWYVAASLALLLSLGIVFHKEIFKADAPPSMVQADTFEDPEKAFEETKKALLLLSSRLNKSNEYAAQFSKFEKSREVVKQN